MVSGSGTTSDRKRGGRRGDARAEGPTMMRRVRRWAWARDPLNIRHHDEECGVACHDDRRLFEMLILEGAQAGLSWSTILANARTIAGSLLASIQQPSHTSRPEMYGVSSPTPASFATARRSRPLSGTRAPSSQCSASSGPSTATSGDLSTATQL